MPLLDAQDAVLLVIDLQERLMPAIAGADAVLDRAGRLAAGAALLGVPVHVTEQNPEKLGPTVAAVAALIEGPVLTKSTFDGSALVPGQGHVVVAGAEAHVCVLQTVLGLRAAGRGVAVVADAVGSRRGADRDRALERARAHGADVVTSEMVLFEWLATSEHPEFRAVQKLIK